MKTIRILFFLMTVSAILFAENWKTLRKADINGDIAYIYLKNNSFLICADELYSRQDDDYLSLSEYKFTRLAGSDNAIFAIKSRDDELYCTRDEGMSWNIFDCGDTSFNWEGIKCVNDMNAAAYGDRFFITKNGGASWSKATHSFAEENTRYYDYINFDSKYEIICCDKNDSGFISLYRRDFGSNHWDKVYESGKKYKKGGFYFLAPETGWLVLSTSSGGDSLLITPDSGKTWRGVYHANNQGVRINKVHFVNEHRGWALGEVKTGNTPVLCSTEDGGFFWKTEAATRNEALSFAFTDTNRFYVGEENGTIEEWRSSRLQPITVNGESLRYSVIRIINKNHVVFGNRDAKRLTCLKNGVIDFTAIPFLPQNLLFMDSLNGVGTSSSGKSIYYTKDGGNNWSSFSNYFSSTWRDLVYDSSHHLWLLGDSLLYSEDKGNNWTDISSQLPYNILINKGQYIGSTLFIIGVREEDRQGALLKKKTSENIFHEIFTEKGYFYDLFFSDPKHGWIANKNDLYHSADSGKTWRLLSSLPSGQYIKSICFLNHQTGWLGTNEGHIYKTIDGGRLFELDYLNNDEITDIKACSCSIYGIGENGLIVKKNVCQINRYINKGARFFSIPGKLSVNDPYYFFQKAKNELSIKGWSIESQSFVQVHEIESANGYLIYSKSPSLLFAINENSDSSLSIHLKKTGARPIDFHLIGNPYSAKFHPYENTSIYYNPHITPYYWVLKNDGYQYFSKIDSSITQGEAFWVANTRETQLDISQTSINQNNSFFELQWEMKIGFEMKAGVDGYYTIGLSPNAQDTVDEFDVYSPPPPPERKNRCRLTNGGDASFQRIVNKTLSKWRGKIFIKKKDTLSIYFDVSHLKDENELFFSLFDTIPISSLPPVQNLPFSDFYMGDPVKYTTTLSPGEYSFTIFGDINSSKILENIFPLDVTNEINLYPNPNHGSFTIQTPCQSEKSMEIKIYNLMGNIIYKKKLHESAKINFIQLKSPSNGIYFVQVKLNDSTNHIKKMVVLK